MNRCLIVVDYQNDFVSGSLGFTEAVALEKKIAAKIDEYHNNRDDVIFTFDTHDKSYLETREGTFLPVEHCIVETTGFELYGEVAKRQNEHDKCFVKSTFGSDKLFDYLRNCEYESIELVGVVSNICVISNAILAKTAQPEVDIIVDAACVASNDKQLNNAALDVMESLQIIIKNGGVE